MKLARHALWLVLLWALAACSPPPPVQQQSYVFGTLVEITVVDDLGSRATPAISEVLARFDELHRTLHAWQPSELSRLNAALARGERATVTPELAAMLRDAQELAAQSDELFNPAIGGLIALWGFHADTPQSRVPGCRRNRGLGGRQPRMADLHIENNWCGATTRRCSSTSAATPRAARSTTRSKFCGRTASGMRW
jgi:FAD:protein FMN transferase